MFDEKLVSNHWLKEPLSFPVYNVTSDVNSSQVIQLSQDESSVDRGAFFLINARNRLKNIDDQQTSRSWNHSTITAMIADMICKQEKKL